MRRTTEAKHYIRARDGRLVCLLCPQVCRLGEGETGECGVRRNEGGRLLALSYGSVASVAIDPIEKKPLYHFHPSEEILSVGAFGCSFHCLFCQNYGISQGRPPTEFISPERLIQLSLRYRSFGIAYTYNEPLIWFEYLLDCMSLAHREGIKNVLVTNGYINPKPLAELIPYTDAANIDLKSMDDSFYRNLCSGRLKPVLNTCKALKDAGVHIEITNLVVTGYNDTDRNFTQLSDWIADELGEDTPLHISAYFPSYRLNAPPTPLETLERAFDIATERLSFVYIGNVRRLGKGHDTFCKKCGTKLVERIAYTTRILRLDENGRCRNCGTDNNFVLH